MDHSSIGDKYLSIFKKLAQEDRMREIAKEELSQDKKTRTDTKEFTTNRQVLAIYYLNEKFRINKIGDKTKLADFICFLTGKSRENIYKCLKSPFKDNEKAMQEDLEYVKKQFENLGLFDVAQLIDGDLK